MSWDMGEEAKSLLLRTARESIVSALEGREPMRPAPHPGLSREAGAFVTLRISGRLRGCIGRMGPSGPLTDTIIAMARAAAFEDPRFPPLRRQELGRLAIEITILSPLRALEPGEEIEIGKHGLYISKGWHSGVLLPQVPVEWGWDAAAFREQVCIKAGLPAAAWKDPDAKLLVFEGLVFGEEEGPRD